MNKIITILFLFVFMVPYSWSLENMCHIVDVKGKILYNSPCKKIENLKKGRENLPSNGIFFLKNAKHSQKVRIKDNEIAYLSTLNFDSVSIVKNRTSFVKSLKKEAPLSDDYYLRTNFFAINGIGHSSFLKAQHNFISLFSYVKNDIQSRFPQDTISTELVFNKTSYDIYTDLVQSVLLKAEELEIKEKFLLDIGSLLFLPSRYIVDKLLNWATEGEYENKVKEFTEYRDELIMRTVPIIGSNMETELKLKTALEESVNNKARALVLGHSQGGMYTYKAFNSFPSDTRTHFYSLNIAVPTDKNPDWFLGNDCDWVLNTFRIPLINDIPEGEPNSSDDGSDFSGESGHYHEWLKSYYNPHLASYVKINAAIENAFRTVPYWEKEKKTAMYQLVWYNGAAQTTIEIAKADGSFVTLGTYHGYNVTDPTVKTVPNVLLQDGVPVLRVRSYHHESWWGPYLSTDPGFFEIISNDDGSLTYLMSDAWSPYSYDDAEFSITLMVE